MNSLHFSLIYYFLFSTDWLQWLVSGTAGPVCEDTEVSRDLQPIQDQTRPREGQLGDPGVGRTGRKWMEHGGEPLIECRKHELSP